MHIIVNNIVTATDSCSQEMKNLIDYFALGQTVVEPTRGRNILDLVLTNQPELVTSSAVVDGISDHNAVVCEMCISYVKTVTGPRRRIFNFEKANVAQINQSLDSYLTVFETMAETKGVAQLWASFKQKLLELEHQFVPSLTLTPRRAKSKPWFTKSLYRLTQKRQKCYQVFRMVPTDEDKRKLRDITCQMKVDIRMAKDSYLVLCILDYSKILRLLEAR